MQKRLSETAEAILAILKDSPYKVDTYGKFITLEYLESRFGEKRMPKVIKAIEELTKADLIDQPEDEDEIWILTPYANTYSPSKRTTSIKIVKESKPMTQPYNYISKELIDRLSTRSDDFKYSKLLTLLDELNDNFDRNKAYSTAAALRAIIDHIPPLLGGESFDEVVSNHKWERSDKSYMKQLLNFRDVADEALHRMIGKKNLSDINMNDIPPKRALDVLLTECLDTDLDKLVAQAEKFPAKKLPLETGPPIVSPLNSLKWASNWSNFGSGFRIEDLEINNYKGDEDYVKEVALVGTEGNGTPWRASIFQFGGLKQNEKMLVPKNRIVNMPIFITDDPSNTRPLNQLDLDKDTVTLVVTFLSGKERRHLFKPGDILSS